MLWDWDIFLAGVGFGAMIFTPFGMSVMYWFIKNDMKKQKGYHENK